MLEHQELMNRMIVQQQQMVVQQEQQQQIVIQQQEQQQEQQQRHQQQQQQHHLLQQQVHRARLELGAAHQRMTKGDELNARLEVQVEELEFRRTEARKKHDGQMAAVNIELEEGRAYLSQANANLSDLQQLVHEQWLLWDQHQQELDQVTHDLSAVQQFQALPPQPSPHGPSSQAECVLEPEVRSPSPQIGRASCRERV